MFLGQLRTWVRSIGFRLNAWYAGVLVLAMLTAIVGGGWLVRRSVVTQHEVFVKTEIQRYQLRIGQSERRTGPAGVAEAIAVETFTSVRRMFVRVANENNQTLAYAGDAPEPSFDARQLQPGEGTRVIQTVGTHPSQPWTLTQVRLDAQRWLQLGVDDRPRRELLSHVRNGLVALLLLALILGTLGGLILTSRALSPVRALAATSRRIVSMGDLDARVPRSGSGDEFDELSKLFNQVLAKNQRLVVGMREALDNVAHDLRTPLSRLRSGAELALSQEDDPSRMRDALADCLEEAERLQTMLRTLMDISEAETGVMRLELQTVDLQKIARDAVELYEHVAEEREIALNMIAEQPVLLKVDPQRIAQVVANLLDNALKYSDPGGRVTVQVRQVKAHAEVAVTDTGVGIEPVHLERIWQRLYRADASRSRRGLGLGLSLVRAVVEAHGGTAHAHSSPNKGSTFILRLPLDDVSRPPA